MIFTATEVRGAQIIDVERLEDERGFFARTWDQRQFSERGLNPRLVQCSISFNHKQGTLRGLHYQAKPAEEARLVRCTRGAIYDVIVDLRPDSPTFMRWAAVELTASSHRMLYVPEGCAHGFQTLTDDTEVFYQMSEFYDPAHARGIRWDDPAFGIVWPARPAVISARDQSFPDFLVSGRRE